MKLFTVEEANRLIPEVRLTLLTIQRLYAEIGEFRESARRAAQSAEHGGGGMASGSIYVNALSELGKLTVEIDSMGIQLKDYSRGLIDFPSMRDGSLVLLCWQLDEGDEVLWWHDLESGFGGRKPL
jgi:hypothetical protein